MISLLSHWENVMLLSSMLTCPSLQVKFQLWKVFCIQLLFCIFWPKMVLAPQIEINNLFLPVFSLLCGFYPLFIDVFKQMFELLNDRWTQSVSMCFKFSSVVDSLPAAFPLQCSLYFLSCVLSPSLPSVVVFLTSAGLPGSLKCSGLRLTARECLTFPYEVEVAPFLPSQWSVNNAANCLVSTNQQSPCKDL